jgi:hypothetical protein
LGQFQFELVRAALFATEVDPELVDGHLSLETDFGNLDLELVDVGPCGVELRLDAVNLPRGRPPRAWEWVQKRG